MANIYQPEQESKLAKCITSRNRPTAAFLGVLVFAFALYYAMTALQPLLGARIFDYNTWEQAMRGNAFYSFLWMIGDATEPHFHKTLLGGIGVFTGSVIAYILDRSKSKLRGIPISYGLGKVWPWIFASAFLSMGIVTALFGSLRIEGDAWAATFVPYVSVASAVIILYGANFKNLLTGATLGAVFTTPITIFIRNELLFSHGLPGVIGSVSGMWIGGIFTFEICRFLPWMKMTPLPAEEVSPARVDGETPVSEYKFLYPNKFFIRRMLADYSEPMFVGNEIAGACLILGSLLTWLLNPMQPYYNTGLFPACILSELLTGAIAMYVYWDGWLDNDFFPTFVPVVSVAPAMVLLFGGAMPVILISAVLGALACPAISLMINQKIPSHWSGMIGFTASMAICSFGISVFMRYLFMVFPGLLV